MKVVAGNGEIVLSLCERVGGGCAILLGSPHPPFYCIFRLHKVRNVDVVFGKFRIRRNNCAAGYWKLISENGGGVAKHFQHIKRIKTNGEFSGRSFNRAMMCQ